MDFAERVMKLEPEGAYFMFDRAQALEKTGRRIIHLEIGQPDVPTFPNIAEAGVQAIRDGFTRYTPVAGMMALRQAIAEDAGLRRGVSFRASQVVVGPGTKPAMFFPTLALVRPGDEVIYPDPGFPTYEAMIGVAGGAAVPAPLSEEDDFSFDLDAFDRLVSRRTRLVVLNSPSNPTGGLISGAALEHIAQKANEYDFWVLTDDIYSRLIYDAPFESIAAFPGMLERTIICDGFSKTYSMAGWRLGYGIMPEPLAERVELLQTHATGCPANFTQVAAIEALRGDQEQVERVLNIYRQRRDVLVAGLNAIPGIHCQTPQGAFYTFPNIKAFGHSADWMANYLLDEAGVAVLPGTSFGKNGEGYLRLCFANSLENILEGLECMASALKKFNT